MSFAIIEDVSFSAGGESWTIELEQWGVSSEDRTLELGKIRRRVGSSEMAIMNPIVGGELRTEIRDEGRFLRDRIAQNSGTDFRLTIKKSSTIYHRGLLRPDLTPVPEVVDSPVLQLEWGGGLEWISGKGWDEWGRETLLSMCHYILTDSARMDLPTRVALAFEDSDADISNGRSRALQHDLERQGDGLSFREALTQVLNYYNLQLIQQGGRWHLLQRSYRESGQSYDWEEKGTSGSISSGSTDPTNSISDSDLYGKPQEGDESRVARRIVGQEGWELKYPLPTRKFRNPDFSETTTSSITGNTVPIGWYLSSESLYDDGNNRIQMFSGDEEATQTWGQVIVEDDSENDSFVVRVKGEFDMQSNNSDTNILNVDLVKIRLFVPENTAEDITISEKNVAEPDTSSKTVSFDRSVTVTPPDGIGVEDRWAVEIILSIEPDPDGDGEDEILEQRWDRAEIKEWQRNASSEARGPDSVQYVTANRADRQKQSFPIGTVSQMEGVAQELHTADGGIRFLQSRSGEWRPLHFDFSDMEHATRSISGEMGEARLKDRLTQTRGEVQRLEGFMKRSTADLIDTLTYDGKDWLIHYLDETLMSEWMWIQATELTNDSPGSNPIDVITE